LQALGLLREQEPRFCDFLSAHRTGVVLLQPSYKALIMENMLTGQLYSVGLHFFFYLRLEYLLTDGTLLFFILDKYLFEPFEKIFIQGRGSSIEVISFLVLL
jgi:hypothetical protein